MKKKELQKLYTQPTDKLHSLLQEKRTELTKQRLEHAVGKIKNTQAMRSIRYDIAQIATIIRQQETKHTSTKTD